MKIEVGMYVRYISGFDNDKPIVRIGKVIEVSEYVIELDTFRNGVFSKSDFLKLCMVGEPSFNPIDIIEVGDIIITKHSGLGKEFVEIINSKTSLEILKSYFKEKSLDLVEVLTKEQFESMSYKVKD